MPEISLLPTYQTLLLTLITGFSCSGCLSTGIKDNTTRNTTQNQLSKAPQINGAKARARNAISIPTKCKKNVLTPAKFTEVNQRLRVFEGSPEYTNTPAEVKWANTRYQIAPASYPQETVPALYKEVTEQIKVLRERTELVGKPAKYKTINKLVTVQEAYTRWKEDCHSDNPEQCFERVPAKMIAFKQKIVDIPARTVQVKIPEKAIELKRKILVRPGKGLGKPIPAEYKDVQIGKVTNIWRIQSTMQPSRYEDIPVRVKLRPERIRKAPAMCTETASATQIKEIQRSLRQRGYNASTQGKLDKATNQAIFKFQQDNDLGIGAITLETLRKLGLSG